MYRTKRRFVLGNLEAALSEEPRPGADRKLSGKEEALLVATACSNPPEGSRPLDPGAVGGLCRRIFSLGDLGVIRTGRALSCGRKLRRLRPKGASTRKLAHTVNRAAPMQAFMGAVPIVVGDPLRELFADVGRFGVGRVPELLQYRSLHTLHFAIQVWGARRYWPKPDGFVHQSALNFLGEELSPPVSLNALD